MLNVKDHHITDKAVKLAKKYFNNFDKTIQRLQLVMFQHRKRIDKEIKTIIVYILNDFKRVYSDELTIFFIFNREKL